MLSIYVKLSRHLLANRRERAAAHMHKELFTFARLKIDPIKNLYHIQCQCVDEFSC